MVKYIIFQILIFGGNFAHPKPRKGTQTLRTISHKCELWNNAIWLPCLKIKSVWNLGIDSSFTKWIAKSFWFETQNANQYEWFDRTNVDYWFSRKSKEKRYRSGLHALSTRLQFTIEVCFLLDLSWLRWTLRKR